MSLNAGARRMGVQPVRLHRLHSIHHRTSPVSVISHSLSQRQINTTRHVATLSSIQSSIQRTNALQAQFRAASTSSASQPKPAAHIASDASTLDTHLSRPPPSPPLPGPLSDSMNPPASTRPPPLDLPTRDPSTKYFTHLFRVGKAYMTFYKTGLKAVYTNWSLLRALPSPTTSTHDTASKSTESTSPTRAALLLRARVRHDTARVPLFMLMVLVCGEFTPLIVLLLPNMAPYTCRIPGQAAKIRQNAETRRAASFRALSRVIDNADASALRTAADGHICRSLGLGSPLWDRTGFDVLFARSRAADAVARIVRDDTLLRHGGGVAALIDDEVVLACEERGINTSGEDAEHIAPIASLRDQLKAWLAKSAPSPTGDVEAMLKEATENVRGLLLGLDGPIR
ncbi:hypothetical protein F5Y12DRAFT_706264 [Xylaria sp. FL1777]|nr:hypothetical protein F5Y12DRAFT_706264 [Xylaria sp. FL1777]